MSQGTDKEESGGCLFATFLLVIFLLCAAAAPEFLGVLIGILPIVAAVKILG